MRKKKTSGSAFIKLRKLPEVSRLPSSPPPDTPSWRLYLRTTDLPLDRFIRAYCEDDLTALVIKGDPPADEIQKAWEAIYDDYTDKMASDNYRDIQEVTKEINLATIKYNAVKTIVQLLEFFPVQEWVDVCQPSLNACLGFEWPLDLSDKILFVQQLEGAMGHAASFFTEAEAMRVTLPKTKAGSASKPTVESFDEMIVILSRYNKYKIQKRETTTSEFCIMMQDMHRGLEAARRAQNN